MGRQHQGNGQAWTGVHQVPEGSGEQREMEETGCEIICGAPTTFVVKEEMMMMMIMKMMMLIMSGEMYDDLSPIPDTQCFCFKK